MHPMDLAGRTVLLTDASGGLSQAIARALHARGASLVATARRSEVLEALAAEVGGEQMEAIAADLTDRADVARLAERCATVDVVVANAGLPASGKIEDFTADEIDRALDVNLRAAIQLAHAAVPGMVERSSGHFVFVSS